MKKILFTASSICLVLALCFAAVCGTCITVYAEEAVADYKTDEAYIFMKEFISENPDRSSVIGEKQTALYLKNKFDALFGEEIATVKSYDAEGKEIVCNVIVELKAKDKTAKTIVVGAHFDAVGQGANDNAGGVTALYLIMKKLAAQNVELPFNLMLVAFGGEEDGMIGSNYFLQNYNGKLSDILLAVSLDSIANGDNLYLFCENKHTALADFILSKAQGKVAIAEKPYAQGVFPIDFHGYGYYEVIQGSDHTPFRLQDIPTALFFSGNYSGWGYVESLNPEKNTMNTNSDTLEALEKNNGGAFVDKIHTIADTVSATLTAADFAPVAENARTELVNNDILFNAWWARLMVFGVSLLLALFAWLYYRKLDKKSVLGTAEVKNDRVFSTPSADNIFDFDDNKDKKDKSSDDIDDIFTFKK